MAVIQTPKGRVIGLIVDDNQPRPETEVVAKEKVAPAEETPKRGRPKKQ